MNALIRKSTAIGRFGVFLPKNNKYGEKPAYLLTRHRSFTASSNLKRSALLLYKPLVGPLPQPFRLLSVQRINDERPKFTNVSYDSVQLARYLHSTRRCYEHTPSSKVEATVQSMKDKQKEKVEEIMKEATTATSTSSTAATLADKKQTAAAEVPVKKPLKTRIWEELVHYYHGFRLLFIDINIGRKLLWRVLNGKTLTRRENKMLMRTTSDIFRLIPFSVFIIVPFMEFLLPFFIKFFPNMLPSTFQTAKEREDKLKQSLQVKLEMAKFLQKTLDEMAVEHRDHDCDETKEFSEFFRRIRDPKEHVSQEDIIKFSKRFEDEITLDALSLDQLSALCRLLELNTIGTSKLLRFQLRVKLRSLAADDRVIAREGVNSLDLFELQQACKARGMRAYGLTASRLRSQLQEWIDTSLNEKVPPVLLLLSRALLVSEESTTTDKLKETIRVLPESVEAQTKVAIGEREGKTDYKTKIEAIKDEERKIKEEREEERQEQAARAETLVDKAPTLDGLETSAPVAHVQKSKSVKQNGQDEHDICSTDVHLLSEALKTLSPEKKMLVEKETIKELKEELAEYKEDVEELREVRNVVKEPIHESHAAKLLFRKVNDMIGQLDQAVTDLEKKCQEQVKLQKPLECQVEGPCGTDTVHIDELVSTVHKLQQTSNESRLKQIENILSKIDADKDGKISVEEVLKVVEALGRENIKLSEKQIEEVVTLLDKEQLIEAEEKIEKAIAKSIKEAESIKAKKEAKLRAETEALAAAQSECSDELKDLAPEIKDKAADLSISDNKNIAVDKETTTSTASAAAVASATTTTDADADASKAKLLPQTDKTDISTAIPPTIPPPNTAANAKDKML